MGRRVRHLNARDAGAAQVYDARFTSFTNNDVVQTWVNRVSPGIGDATQATVGSRPIFNDGGLNNVAAMNFSGSKFFIMPTASVSDIEIIVVGKHALKAWSGNYDISLQVYIDQNHTTYRGFVLQTRPDISSTAVNFGASPPSSGDPFQAVAQVANIYTMSRIQAGNGFAWINGNLGLTIVGSTSWIAASPQYIGRWGGGTRFLDGQIGTIILFQKRNSSEMRRRLEQSAAFAFKIPCL